LLRGRACLCLGDLVLAHGRFLSWAATGLLPGRSPR
jgi:hypothetical protein